MLSELIKKTEHIRKSFSGNDLVALRNESNECIEEATLTSDKILAKISVTAYALQKLLSKPHIVHSKKWKEVKRGILSELDKAIHLLKEENIKGFERELDLASKRVLKIDLFLGNYTRSVFDKGKIKQASRAYGLGLSLSQAADLTGADSKDLFNYIGATKIHDEEKIFLSLKERKNFLRGLFKE